MLVGLICRRAHPFCQLHPGERALHGAGACLALDQLLEAEHPALQSHLPGIPIPLVVLLPVAIVSALLACAHRLNGLCFARWGLIAHHVVAWPSVCREGLGEVDLTGCDSADEPESIARRTELQSMLCWCGASSHGRTIRTQIGGAKCGSAVAARGLCGPRRCLLGSACLEHASPSCSSLPRSPHSSCHRCCHRTPRESAAAGARRRTCQSALLRRARCSTP